jgi:phosphotransferase system enzyme I (PtsP)
MLSAGDIAGQGEHFEVLETYRLFAQDQGWRNRMMEAVQSGLTAEAAVQKVQNDTRARMREMTDPYLRERLGRSRRSRQSACCAPAGRRHADAARCRKRRSWWRAPWDRPSCWITTDAPQGLVLEEGSQNAHVAIVARALDIPVLGRCQDLMQRVGDWRSAGDRRRQRTLFIRPSKTSRRPSSKHAAALVKREGLCGDPRAAGGSRATASGSISTSTPAC